ncbi:MAG TPA: hemerythrin domain-containing protein [Dehalococcoidia bacterium]|nr:hemerythrin domain-containing protein [Dehalococcoidia bacterium]
MARRHDSLIPLSREHHTALVLALRIEREVPDGEESALKAVYDTLIAFWAQGLLPHFRAENECLLARLVRHIEPEHELVLRTHRDHLGIEALVASMRDTEDLTERRRLLREFAGKMRTHIRWEDDVLFDKSEAMLMEVELGRLAEDISDRVGDGNAWEHRVWPGWGRGEPEDR